MVLSIWNTFVNGIGQFKNWFFNHYENPILWILLVVFLVAIVMWGYNYLHRR